jgi:hypothetical protein
MTRYTTKDLTRVSALRPYERLTPETYDMAKRHNFVTALQGECPHFQFGYENDEKLFVYVDGETYTRGWIGYANFNDTGGEEKFGVWCKKIVNGKYAPYSLQHHLKTSKLLKNAVKAAKGYLSAITTLDLNGAYFNTVGTAIDSKMYSFKSEVHGKNSALGLRDTDMGTRVQRELINLFNSGHEFLDPDLPPKIAELVEAIGERADNVANKFMTLVWKDGNKVRTGEVDTNAVWYNSLSEEKVYDTPEMLPMEIRNKISILQVADDEAYLMDTGMRFGEDIFYVQV